MKYAVAAALFALAAAQTRDDIPKCALPCLDDAVKSGTNCAINDYACICPHVADLTGSATGCVLKECGTDVALNKVLPAVQALCAAQGTAPASSSAPASTASSAPATTGSESATTPATTAPATTTPKSTQWTTVPCDTTTVAHTPSGNSTQPKPTSTVPVAGAAGLSVGVAAIALAALAL